MKVFEKTNRIFLLTLIGCLSFSLTPTTSGFITDAHRLVKSNLLISKVHEPSWKIGYRYGADCKPKDRQDKVLEETITRALQAWLTPLRELQPDRPITNNFTFHLQEDFHGDTDENLEGRWAVDVRITFRCARVSSFALIGSGDAPPDIFVHWGDEENDTLSDLTHELGHAFGLADTYLHRGIRSTGGLPGTVGTQPSSAMSFYFPEDQIGGDDKRGIIWFYKHFYEGLELEDCFFPDYVLEKEPRGCRPKHPLIFEVKHGRRTFVLKLLNKAPTIDVNAQDAAGMTALHPAPQTKSVRYIGILCNLKNSSYLYSIHIHTRLVVLYRTYVSISYPVNRFYSVDSSSTSNGRLKRERMPFAVAKMIGERIIRRSNLRFPGISLMIIPISIVKTPCPGKSS